jgi:hypothetical protein
VKRGHGDLALGNGREVRIGIALVAGLLAVDVEAAPPFHLLGQLELVAVDALAQAAGPDSAHVAGGTVHVQERARRHGHVLELLDHPGHEGGGLLEVLALPGPAPPEVDHALLGLLRDGDRRDTQHHSLQCGRNRARVGDVVAEVRAVVDAGHDQLGLELDQAQGREANAVDGRAVRGVADAAVAEFHLVHPQGPAGGDRAGGGASVGVGRDRGKLHSRHLQECSPHHVQAGGLDAVVVGKQHFHGRSSRINGGS